MKERVKSFRGEGHDVDCGADRRCEGCCSVVMVILRFHVVSSSVVMVMLGFHVVSSSVVMVIWSWSRGDAITPEQTPLRGE